MGRKQPRHRKGTSPVLALTTPAKTLILLPYLTQSLPCIPIARRSSERVIGRSEKYYFPNNSSWLLR